MQAPGIAYRKGGGQHLIVKGPVLRRPLPFQFVQRNSDLRSAMTGRPEGIMLA